MKVHAIEQVFTTFGEGPIWDEENKCLYLVDLAEKKVLQYEPETESCRSYLLPDLTTSVVKAKDNQLICVMKNELYLLDLQSEELNPLLQLEDVEFPYLLNDAKCDPYGNIWVGAVNDRFRESKEGNPNIVVEQDAALYRIDEKLQVTAEAKGFTVSNGLDWDPNRNRMYFVDSAQASILMFDFYPETGEIRNESVVYTFDELNGFPDGMTIDQDGMLWVALFKPSGIANITPKHGMVAKIDPINKKWIDTIYVPVSHVTSCAFGGEDLRTLYITTAIEPLPEGEREKQKQAGQLFKVELDVGGYPGKEFRPQLKFRSETVE